jgi:hypothetical protein
MRRRGLLLIACWLVTRVAGAAIFDDEHPRDRERFAAFRLWWPDDLAAAKVLIVLVPGYNRDGREMVNDPVWQAFAREHEAALLACFLTGHESGTYQWPQDWSGKLFDTSLSRLAAKSEHPEIATAPILMWGHSAGGQFTYNFACWKPERLLAFGVDKGGVNFLQARPATLRLPALFVAAEHDETFRVVNLAGVFSAGRRTGASWCFAVEAGIGHENGRAAELARSFFAPIVKQARGGFPALRWYLGDLSTHEIAVGGGEAPGRVSAWLPDEATAQLWRKIVSKPGAP